MSVLVRGPADRSVDPGWGLGGDRGLPFQRFDPQPGHTNNFNPRRNIGQRHATLAQFPDHGPLLKTPAGESQTPLPDLHAHELCQFIQLHDSIAISPRGGIGMASQSQLERAGKERPSGGKTCPRDPKKILRSDDPVLIAYQHLR